MAETRAYTAETNDVDRDARTVVATINTDAIDRYMTVVDPSGAQLENYRKNPVVLFNHGDGSTPIGKNLWIKANKNRLIAKTQFVPAGMDPVADRVFELYAQGFLSAWSVSFAPIDAGSPTPEELRARPALADCRCIYRKWDLLEYSCVFTTPTIYEQEFFRLAGEEGVIAPAARQVPLGNRTVEWPALDIELPGTPDRAIACSHGSIEAGDKPVFPSDLLAWRLKPGHTGKPVELWPAQLSFDGDTRGIRPCSGRPTLAGGFLLKTLHGLAGRTSGQPELLHLPYG